MVTSRMLLWSRHESSYGHVAYAPMVTSRKLLWSRREHTGRDHRSIRDVLMTRLPHDTDAKAKTGKPVEKSKKSAHGYESVHTRSERARIAAEDRKEAYPHSRHHPRRHPPPRLPPTIPTPTSENKASGSERAA
eukprot:3496696-Rhodomonas_salina.1